MAIDKNMIFIVYNKIIFLAIEKKLFHISGKLLYLVLINVSRVFSASESKDWLTVEYLVMSLLERTGT